jgi:hypothetical protein
MDAYMDDDVYLNSFINRPKSKMGQFLAQF